MPSQNESRVLPTPDMTPRPVTTTTWLLSTAMVTAVLACESRDQHIFSQELAQPHPNSISNHGRGFQPPLGSRLAVHSHAQHPGNKQPAAREEQPCGTRGRDVRLVLTEEPLALPLEDKVGLAEAVGSPVEGTNETAMPRHEARQTARTAMYILSRSSL